MSAAAVVATAAASTKAMAAPAVAVTPVGPWAYAQKDAVIKVARAVKAIGGAGVGRVVVVAVRADRLNAANADDNLRFSGWNE